MPQRERLGHTRIRAFSESNATARASRASRRPATEPSGLRRRRCCILLDERDNFSDTGAAARAPPYYKTASGDSPSATTRPEHAAKGRVRSRRETQPQSSRIRAAARLEPAEPPVRSSDGSAEGRAPATPRQPAFKSLTLRAAHLDGDRTWQCGFDVDARYLDARNDYFVFELIGPPRQRLWLVRLPAREFVGGLATPLPTTNSLEPRCSIGALPNGSDYAAARRSREERSSCIGYTLAKGGQARWEVSSCALPDLLTCQHR